MYGFLGLPYCTEQMTCDRFESDVENKRTLLRPFVFKYSVNENL